MIKLILLTIRKRESLPNFNIYIYDKTQLKATMNHHHEGVDMDMDMCSMNMSFTWSYKNLCIIFGWWQIKTTMGLILSCLTLTLISITYEWFRYRLQIYNRGKSLQGNHQRNSRIYASVLYGIQVAFSFLLMLVFMTYNGWLMISVILGAILGHYWFAFRQIPQQLDNLPLLSVSGSMACH